MSKNGYDQFFKTARATKAQGASQASHTSLSPDGQGRPKIAAGRDSKKVAEQLRQRIQSQAVMKKKQKSKTPWKLIAVSSVGVVIAGLGLKFNDTIYDHLKKVEISLIGGAQAQSVPPAASVAPVVAPSGTEATPSTKKEYTQAELDHFSKLNERKRELDAREEEIAKMEAEIIEKRAALEKRLSELENTRSQISQVLQDRVNLDQERIETLVQMYSNMKPSQAARVFETMDEDLAVEIIGRMKKKNAAEIMNLVKPEKAQIFSERYAGYKRETP